MLVEVQLAVNSMIDCKHYSFILLPFGSQILSRDEIGVANDEDVIIANDIVKNTIAGAFRQQLICFLTLISSKLIWISAAYVAPASAIEKMIVSIMMMMVVIIMMVTVVMIMI